MTINESFTPQYVTVVLSVIAAIMMPATSGCLAPTVGPASAPGGQPAGTARTQIHFDPLPRFERVWAAIRDNFWDPEFNGVNWIAMHDHYLPLASKCQTETALAQVINDMLSHLNTSHTRYLTSSDPSYYVILSSVDSNYMAARRDIGLDAIQIDGQYFVRGLLAGDEAERAGVRVGDRLISVDGKPFHPADSFRGVGNRSVTLEVQRRPGRIPIRFQVAPKLMSERERIFRATTNTKVLEERGLRIGYIRLWWLGDQRIREYFPGLLKGLLELRRVHGIIVDLRDGYGGGFESFLTPLFAPAYGSIRTIPRDRTKEKSFGIGGTDAPIVLLINKGSRSGKELFAYYIKKLKRGRLVGEATAGFVAKGRVEKISKDSILYYCAAMLEIDGVRLENRGVEPHIHVPFDIRYCNGIDPQLERAKGEIFDMIRRGEQL